jgi:hypothetical protein
MAAPITNYTPLEFFGRLFNIDDLDTSTLRSDHLSVQTFIPLDICALREIITNEIGVAADAAARGSGGILTSDTTPTLKRVNAATNKALRVTWAASNSDEVQFPPVPWPPDLDPAGNVVVHLLLSRAHASDEGTITVSAFENTVTGSAYAADTEMGSATAALTGDVEIIIEKTVTLTAGNIVGHPGFLNLSLTPAAHTNGVLYLWSAWLEFTRQLRTT